LPENEIKFTLKHAGKGIDALAMEIDGEFVVLAGATGSLNTAPSFQAKQRDFRDQILESGRAEKLDGKTFRLTQDVAFSSPSAASVFLFGTSRNGRTDWVVEGQEINYGTWYDAKLEAAG